MPAEPTPTPAEPTPAPTADTPEPPAAPTTEPASVKSAKPTTKPTAPAPAPSATPTAPATPSAPAAPTAPARAAAPAACGEEGQPRCPLQAFMEDEIDRPLEDGALEQVAAAMAKVAKMAPDPAWNAAGPTGFRGLAEAAAAAARANDVPTLQQTCKSCHKAFRREYKAKYRPRPLP